MYTGVVNELPEVPVRTSSEAKIHFNGIQFLNNPSNVSFLLTNMLETEVKGH